MDHLSQIFNYSVANNGYRPLFWTTPTTFTTYTELMTKVKIFINLLMSKQVKKGSNVVIIGNNSDDFMAVCQATWSLGGTIVPMYEKQNLDVKIHIINQTQPTVLFNSGQIIENINYEQINHATYILNNTTSSEFVLSDVDKEEIAVIIYTSGTTGLPKGVVLTHNNIISNMRAMDFGSKELPVTVNDVYVSFLPWSHVYGLTCEILFLIWKCASTHLNTNIATLKQDFLDYNPTIICTVPKLLAEITKNASVKFVSKYCPSFVINYLDIRTQIFGKRLKHIACGGSSISEKTLKLMHNLKIKIYQGYGITECSPLISLNSVDNRIGSVGKILNCNIIKLAEENQEILVSGSNVAVGYYRNTMATDESFINICGLRYFKTGDQGRIDADGYLYITARLKETFKLDNGKFCNPTIVEDIITSHSAIKFAMIYVKPGDERPRLIASTNLTVAELKDELVKMKIDKFMIPDKITVTEELFTIDNNLVTPKQSLRRNEIIKHFDL